MQKNISYTLFIALTLLCGINRIYSQGIDTLSNSKTTNQVIMVDSPASQPFAFADFSWLNGTSRKTK
ncbi:MAG TPA: hypothetical protein VII44_05930 [Puia sp.]